MFRSRRGILSYIVFLHQTTTQGCGNADDGCIVLYRLSTSNHNGRATFPTKTRIVLYRLSTSNHNMAAAEPYEDYIVLYRLSTSNHNNLFPSTSLKKLSYIVFLHQTTTEGRPSPQKEKLSYIVFLHQTTTGSGSCSLACSLSYIVFLHQTTTIMLFIPTEK